MSLLLNGDCIELMKEIEDDSVDLIFCDLPYGQTSCKWDIIIAWEPFWNEIMRVKKLNTPVFFTTTTKFGVELINNAPKKCPFRWDLVWVKSTPIGFLSAKKMPMRKHEMVYAFYEKLPFYDLTSNKHKFLKPNTPMGNKPDMYGRLWDKNGKPYIKEKQHSQYSPSLPTSVVKEGQEETYTGIYSTLPKTNKGTDAHSAQYDPTLPTSMLEIKSTRGKHSTEKPVALMEWLLKYFSKEGDVVLDPTMGSGSTGVACKNMNRNFIGIEKDEEIYDGAVERIETTDM
jgi:site-specific DNA-methyltransferase (adenine-specific)